LLALYTRLGSAKSEIRGNLECAKCGDDDPPMLLKERGFLVDIGAGEAVGHAVVMGVGYDVIIDADTARAPFAEDVRLDRQRLLRRAIDLLQQLPARHAEPPDRTLFVEHLREFADRRVDLGETVECSKAQPPRDHLSTMSTACSTLSLSLERLGRASKMAVS
jgi:hypothetical protein